LRARFPFLPGVINPLPSFTLQNPLHTPPFQLTAWDYDEGMEGSNDRIGATVALAVQECWYFFKSINNMQTCSTPCQTFPPTAHLAHAHTPPRFSVRVGYACAGRLGTASWQRVQCTDEPEYRDGRRRGADCAATDSSWQMEEREVCNGTTWVDLDRGVSGAAAEPLCAAGAAACLLIDVLVVRGAPLRARSLALSCRQLAQRHPSFSGDRTSCFFGVGAGAADAPSSAQV
jgi:hypothetical protein